MSSSTMTITATQSAVEMYDLLARSSWRKARPVVLGTKCSTLDVMCLARADAWEVLQFAHELLHLGRLTCEYG